MRSDPPESGQPPASVSSRELAQADDGKLRRIVVMLDGLSNASANQAILGPVRARVAVLKPVRPLRFTRLLFIPFDPLIVSARDWRPGLPAFPRNAMLMISTTVRAGLGIEATVIDEIIAGHGTDSAETITRAGKLLWPRAADILAVASPPGDWAEMGFSAAAWSSLARAIASVFRRATSLERLVHEAATGAGEPNEAVVSDIMRDIDDEPAEGCAMVVRLILLGSPQAATLVRQMISGKRNVAEKARLSQAVACATEEVLAHLESDAGIQNEVSHGAKDAGEEVRRMVTLLRELDNSVGGAAQRPRLRAIQAKLDEVCRERFSNGMREVVVEPLADVSCPINQAGQTRLEAGARDLRGLETVARKVGSPDVYDRQLADASKAVRAAVGTGVLTPMRGVRLMEILAGPEPAEELFRREVVGKSAARPA